MSICDRCNAPKEIKESMGCSGDRLHNAWEDFKHKFCKLAKREYKQDYQCRFEDLVEKYTRTPQNDEVRE